MATELLALPFSEGTLLIGSPYLLDNVAGTWRIDSSIWSSRIQYILVSHTDSWHLRRAAVSWGVEEFDPRQRTEQLHDQIARLVEIGRSDTAGRPGKAAGTAPRAGRCLRRRHDFD
jgi:hypothetical protein